MTRAVLPLIPRRRQLHYQYGSFAAAHGLLRAARPTARQRPANCKSPGCCGSELNGTGIRVGKVDPGLAETEFSLVRFKGEPRGAKKPYEGTNPCGEDVAEFWCGPPVVRRT